MKRKSLIIAMLMMLIMIMCSGVAFANNTSVVSEVNETSETTIDLSLSDVYVQLSQSVFEYDGQAKTPGVVVVLNGTTTLAKGSSYSVDYINNVEIGTATAIITGTGAYTGEIRVDYSIVSEIPQSYEVVVDTTAPIISNVTATVENGNIAISANIEDPNMPDGSTVGSGVNENATRYAVTKTPIAPAADSEEWKESNVITNVSAIEVYVWVKAEDNVANVAISTEEVKVVLAEALITEWTIPVNADTDGTGTTIKLPIPSYASNSYIVDWGDGTIEEYTSEAFPTHEYKNTSETTYTIKIAGTVQQFGYLGDAVPESTGDNENYYTFTQYLTKLIRWGELYAYRYGFSKCTNLGGTIPSPSENSFVKVYSMANLFDGCSSLTGTIPEDLFTNTPEVDSFTFTFKGCTRLEGTIPAGLFNGATVAEDMYGVFMDCTGLEGDIPGELFSNNVLVEDFGYVFSGCTGLKSIPATLFAENTAATSFEYAFDRCTGLTCEIPGLLFSENKNAENFGHLFYNCTGLSESIPADLFTACQNATNFQWTFYNCSGLTGEIPTGFFAGRTTVTNFAGVFYGCSGLEGSIPGDLFDGCTNVSNYQHVFYNCSKLSGIIPASLFEDSPLATNFNYTFYGCSSLEGGELRVATTDSTTTIGMFKGATALEVLILDEEFKDITSKDTFYNCPNLKAIIMLNNASSEEEVGTLGALDTIVLPAQTIIYVPTEAAEGNYETAWTGIIDATRVEPIFVLEGQKDVTLKSGAAYVEEGYTVAGYDLDNEGKYTKHGFEVVISDSTPDAIGNYVKTYTLNKSVNGTSKEVVSETRNIYVIDDSKALITEWTIPANTDSDGTGTTIRLPIEANGNNSYTVDWGDGTIETYTSEDCPAHEYTNSAETKYTIKVTGKVEKFGCTDWNAPSADNKYYTFAQYLTGLKAWGEVEAVSYGFANCINLEGAIPASTENTFVNINEFASLFLNCKNITSLPENLFKNASKAYNLNNAFNGCSRLTTLPETLLNGVTNVQGFYGTFQGCNGLTQIPEGLFKNNKQATMFGLTFTGCTSLTQIPENLFVNNENVTSFESTFNGCTGITSIPAGLFSKNTKVKQFNATFYGCNGLTGDIPRELFANTKEVTTFSGMFNGCVKLTGGELLIDTSNNPDLSSMFWYCPGITTLILGEGFKNINGSGMFNGSNNLKALILSNNAASTSEAGTLGALNTINLPEKTIIYVPTEAAESNYEAAWTGIIDGTRIEPILSLVGEDKVTIEADETYTEEGYNVAGYPTTQSGEYTKYGYEVTTSDSEPTDAKGSFVRTYTLKRTVDEVETTVMEATRTIEVEVHNYSVNGVFFETLEEARKASKNGDTIVVENTNFVDSSYVYINRNITIDTNGNTVIKDTSRIDVVQGYTVDIIGSGTIGGGANCHIILNEGTLNIKDVTIRNENTTETYNAIFNKGTLNMESGTISARGVALYNTGTANIKGGQVLGTADDQGNFDSRNVRAVYNIDGLLNVTGGYLSAINKTVNAGYGTRTIGGYGGTIEITGGTIYSESEAYSVTIESYVTSAKNPTKINISGDAEIIAKTSTGDAIAILVNSKNNVMQKVDIDISGGTITVTNPSDKSAFGIDNNYNEGNITITGGTITADKCGIRSSAISTGTITLGSKTEELSTTTPSVFGGDYGINAPNGFNFYNGVIKASNETTYYGTPELRDEIYYVKTTGPENEVYSSFLAIDENAPIIEVSDVMYPNSANITITDAESGLTHWAVTSSEAAPTTTGDTNSTTGNVLNQWYPVEKTTNTTTVSFSGLKVGKYYAWAKDAKGNTQHAIFAVKADPILIAESYDNANENGYILGNADIANGDLAIKRDKIKTITILDLDEEPIPTAAVASWDVSKNKDGSVTAWLVEDTTDATGTLMYKLYIGGYGGVIASSGGNLFANYTKCTEIKNLNKLSTTGVETMARMFYGLNQVTSLDLSNLTTNSVKDMSAMFHGCSSLTSLTLANFTTTNVTSMANMFQDCSSLTSLDLTSFNTTKVKYMANMFNNCSKITEIKLSNFDTTNVIQFDGMFQKCIKLEKLDVSNFVTTSAQNMNLMFQNCEMLSTINVSNFKTGSVTGMQYMFSGCKAVTELDVSGFDTSRVTSFKSMFADCKLVKKLDVSKFKTSAATSFSAMFQNCESVENLNVTGFDTSGIKEMVFMFENCKSLTSLDLSNFDTSALDGTDSGYSFMVDSVRTPAVNADALLNKCSKLKTVLLGPDFQRIDGRYMFSGTNDLKAIIAISEEAMDITNDNGALADNGLSTSSTIIYVPTSTIEIVYENAWSGIFDAERVEPMLELKGEKQVTVPAGETYIEDGYKVAGFETTDSDAYGVYGFAVTTSDSEATDANGSFVRTYTLNRTVGETTTAIGEMDRQIKYIATDPILLEDSHENAIEGKYLLGYERYSGDVDLANIKRTSIKTITILDTSEANTIPTKFAASWDVSKENNGSVTSWLVQDATDTTMYHLYIGGKGGVRASEGEYLFAEYTKCTSINNLSKLDTSNVKSMYYMFNNCNNLKTVDVSKLNTSEVTKMQNMFNNCYLVETLDVTKFDTSKVTNMLSLFRNCRGLTSLDVSNFDTTQVDNMQCMFEGIRLTTIDVSGLETGNVTTMRGMFFGCSNLTSIDLSTFNTDKVKDMFEMFSKCTNLTSVNLSSFNTSNVTTMGGMFNQNSSLVKIDLRNFNTGKANVNSMFNACSKLELVLLGANFDRINGSKMFTDTTNLKSIISYRTTPMSVTDSNGAVVDNGLNTSNTSAVIYVSNDTIESAYEKDSNYASLLGFTVEENSTRVEPILGVYGENPIVVAQNGSYDEAATVAGFKSITDSDITPTEVKPYGYALTQTSNNVDLTTPGNYQVTYELTLPGDKVDTVTRDVKVMNPNYSVDGVFYETLADAYASIDGNEGTIVVERDNTDDSTFTVKADKKIIINTNGKTITKTVSPLTNNGTLTIEGTGTIQTADADENAFQMLIYNGGELNVENGNLINKGILSGYWGVIENISENSVVNIKGGTIKSTLTDGVTAGKVGIGINVQAGTVNMSGGTVINELSTGTVINVHNNNADNGLVNITGGTVNALNGSAIYLTSSEGYTNGTDVKISGGTIIGAGQALYSDITHTGNIDITGGTIKNRNLTIPIVHKGQGIMTLGTKDGNVSTTTPEVIGRTNAIKVEPGSVFNFYDGILKGEAIAIEENSTIADIEDGYKIVTGTETVDEITYQTAYLVEKEDNYSVDGEYFETLAEAYASIDGNEGTIVVERDNTDNTPVTIAEDKNIVIDLNGKVVTKNDSNIGRFITNAGTLEIKDSVGNGAINMSHKDSTRSTLEIIYNTGTLNISSGTYTSTTNKNNTRVIQNEGIANIDGGYFESAFTGSDGSSVGIVADGGALNFNGGTIVVSGGNGIANYGRLKAIINISGGEINSDNGGICFVNAIGDSGNNGSGLNISGTATINTKYTSIYNDYATGGINITGGTITSSESRGIYNSAGSVTIGTEEGSVNTSSPIIKGSTYGIESTTDINFYDGIFKGQTSGMNVTGTVTTPVGYIVTTGTETIDEETYQTAYLVEKEKSYSVDGKYFKTLAEAYASITGTEQTTIKVEQDNTDNTPVTIAEDKNIVIDLNGKTITVDSVDYLFITNNGRLEMKDSVGNGRISMNYDTTNNSLYLIKNTNELTITSGTYELNVNDASVTTIVSDGTTTINDGIINAKRQKTADWVAGILVQSGILNMSDGTVNAIGPEGSGFGIASFTSNIATINVTGGTITSTAHAIGLPNSGAQASMTDVNVSGTAKLIAAGNGIALHNYSGNITVTGGTIEAKHYAICEQTPTITGINPIVTIGAKGGNVSTTVPELIGGLCGIVLRSDATFNFYDGILKGQTSGIEENTVIADIEDGYKIVTGTEKVDEITYQTAYLVEKEKNYSVDGKYFETLAEAYASITGTEQTTIKVERDNTDNTPVTIAEDKNVVIDLNGKTITVDNINGTFITNSGTLEMKDSVGNGKIDMKYVDTTSGLYVIDNNCDLTIASGAYSVDTNKGFPAVVRNSVGTTNINGGLLQGNNSTEAGGATWSAGIFAAGGTLNVNGGTIIATLPSGNVYCMGIINQGENAANINITGGTIRATSGKGNLGLGIVLTDHFNGNGNSDSKLKISGNPTIIGEVYGIYNTTATADIEILGGTISSSSSYAVHNVISKTIIGDKTNAVSTTSPVIIGGPNGVNVTGDLEFYDGILKGTSSGIYAAGTVITPTGYEVVTGEDGDYKTAYLKKTPTIIANPSPATVTYGSNAEVELTYSGDGELDVTSANRDIATATISENKVIVNGVAKGETTLTVTLAESEEYAASKLEIPVTVVAKDISELEISLSPSTFNFDGTAKEPTAIIAYAGKDLVKDTDFTILYADNTDAGRATATITGKGNFSGSKEVYFTIKDAKFTVTASGYTDEYDGSEHRIAVNVEGVTDVTNATIKYGTSEGNYTETIEPIFKDVVDTVVYFQVSMDNYETYTSSVVVTITQKVLPVTWTNTTLTYNGEEQKPTATITNDIANEEVKLEVTGEQKAVGNNYDASVSIASVTNGKVTNYKLTNTTTKFSIVLAGDTAFTATLDENTFTYDGAEHKPIPTVTTVINGTTVTLVQGTHYEIAHSEDVINVGDKTVTITGIGSYTGVNTTVNYSIEKATITVTPDALSKVYGDADPALTHKDTGAVGTEKPGFTGNLERASGDKVGEYAINKGNLALADNGTFKASNYKLVFSSTTVNFTITPKSIAGAIVTTIPAEETFDGEAKNPTVIVTLDGKQLNQATECSVNITDNVNVGTANVTVTGTGNYTGTATGTFKITEATLTVVANDYEEQYDGNYHGIEVEVANAAGATITYGVTEGNYNLSESPTYKDADEYTVYFKVSKENYTDYTGSAKVIISKRDVAVNWSNLDLKFNNKEQGPTAEATAVDGETINLKVDGKQVNIGTYTARASIDSVTKGKVSNYNLTNAETQYTISLGNVDLDVSLDQEAFTYIGTPHTPTAIVKANVEGEEVTLKKDTDYTVRYEKNIDAGTANVIITGIGNYDGLTETVTFTINKNNLTIRPIAGQRKYIGEADPKLKYNHTGNMAGEIPGFTGDLTRTPGEELGSYAITQGTLNIADTDTFKVANYNMIFDNTSVYFKIMDPNLDTGSGDTDFEIIAKEIEVVWENTVLTYNGTPQKPTAKAETGISGERIVLAVVGEQTDVGEGYEATAYIAAVIGGQTEINNYTLKNVSTTFKIIEDVGFEFDVSLDNTSFEYNGKEQKPKVTVTVEKDGVTKTLTENTHYELVFKNNTNVGTATVTVIGLEDYAGAEKVENFTITKKTLTIIPDSEQGKVYGEAEPDKLKYTVVGNVSGESPNFLGVLTRDPGNNVGSYAITQGTLKVDSSTTFDVNNYNVEFDNTVKFTISPKNISELTIELDPPTFVFDGTAKEPAAIIVYGGKELIKDTDFTIDYDNNTNAGEAIATIKGKGNFTGEKEVGFTITDAKLSVTAEGHTGVYDGLSHGIKVEVSGDTDVSDAVITYGTRADNCEETTSPMYKDVGTYTVFYKVTKANYETYTSSAVIEITAKPVEVKWTNTTLTYNGADQKPTAKAEGVSGETINLAVSGDQINVGGPYKATASIESVTNGSASNYELTNTETSFNIVLASDTAFEVTLDKSEFDYDGVEHKPIPTVTTVVNGETKTLIEGTHYEVEYEPDNTNAGDKIITITGIKNYAGIETTVDFTINKVTLTIKPDSGLSKVFGKADPTLTYVISGAVGTEEPGIEGTLRRADGEDVGTYLINQGTFKVVNSATFNVNNYNVVFDNTVTFEITPMNIEDLTIELNPSTFDYDGTAKEPAVIISYNGKELESGDSFTVSYKDNVEAGQASATITGQGNFAGEKEVYFTIDKIKFTVTAEGHTGVYDGLSHGIKVEVTGDTDVSDALITYGTSANNCEETTSPMYKDVGTYTVFYKVTKANYETYTSSAVIEITAKPVEVKWTNTTLTYNGADQKPTAKAEGVSGETINLAVSGDQINVGGPYKATASIESVTNGKASNYELTNTETSFNIILAGDTAFTATLDESTFTYDGVEHKPIPTVTTVINGTTVTLVQGTHYEIDHSEDVINVGDKTVTITGIGSYTGVNTSVNYAITEATITVTPNALSKVYGDADPKLTYVVSGAQNSEKPEFTGDLERASGEKVGEYPINKGDLALTDKDTFKASNYKLVFSSTTVNFTITAKDISSAIVTTEPTEYTYDGTAKNPTVIVTLGGKQLNQATECSVSITKNVNAGDALVTVTGIGNYAGIATGTFKINKAEFEVTATGHDEAYDGLSHGITVEVNGVTDVSDAKVMYGTVEGTYNLESSPEYKDVEEYTVYFKVTKENYKDYTGSAKVIITKKDVTVVWGNRDLTFTNKPQAPIAGATGVNGEIIVLKVTGEQTNVGENYSATASIESVTNGKASNYNLVEASTTFNIKLDENTSFNARLDESTFTYDGAEHKPEPIVTVVVDGETLTLEAGKDYSVEHSEDSTNVGNKVVTITGIGNYIGVNTTVNYSIEKATITVTPNALSKVYGDTDPELTHKDVGAAGSEKPGFTGKLERAEGEDVGTYAISLGTLALADNGTFKASNYELEFSTTVVNFSITARDIASAIVTATPNEFTYNGTTIVPDKITVTLNSKELDSKTDYTIKIDNNVNAGDAIITVTGKGNYKGTATGTFKINKAKFEVTATGYTGAYDGLMHRITVAVNGVTDVSDAKVMYGTKEGTYNLNTSPEYKDVGEYTVYFKVTKDNYEDYVSSAKVVITVKEVSVLWGELTLLFNNKEQTPTATANGVTGETISLNISGAKKDVGGPYKAIASIKDVENGLASNYKLVNEEKEFTIIPDTSLEFNITLDKSVFTYDGTYHTPTPTIKVTINGEVVTLVKDKDYTVEHTNNKNVANGTTKPTVTIKGIKNYAGIEDSINFTINRATLTVTPDSGLKKEYSYDDPAFTYKWSGNISGETPKFSGTLSRVAGKNPGTYEIVKGTLAIVDNVEFIANNYNMVVTPGVTFEITTADISKGTVTLKPTKYEHDGTAKEPETTVVVNEITLERNRDYTVKYTNNIEVGMATATITGTGNYKGTLSATFEITKPDITNGKLTINPLTYEYDGTEKRPNTTVEYRGVTLERNVDYTVEYENNINAGKNTAIVIVKGIGEYIGELRGTFTITKAALVGEIHLSQDTFVYDGTEKKPTVTFVTQDGKILEEDVDFTVVYEDNVETGTATVIVTGKGNYEGTRTKDFEIIKAQVRLVLKDKIVMYNGNIIEIDKAVIENANEDLSEYIVYKYFKEGQLDEEMTTHPREVGVYYAKAEITDLINYNNVVSNTAKLVIYGAPTKPTIIGTVDGKVMESGHSTNDKVVITISGSEVPNVDNVEFGYKYSLDGTTWKEYTGPIDITDVGTTTIYAKAYLKDNSLLESDATTYTVTIDKTAPEISNVIVPSKTDTVVVDVKVKGDDIYEVFITDDPSQEPNEEEWLKVGENGETVIELPQGDGNKDIYVWARDEAGNITGPVKATTTLSALKLGNQNDNKTTIMFKVTDDYMHTANINVEDIAIYVNDLLSSGKVTSITKEQIDRGYKFTAIMEDVTGDGKLSIGLIGADVFDKAGNKIGASMKAETNEITVDNTLPNVNISVTDNVVYIVASDDNMKAVMVNGEVVGRTNGQYSGILKDGVNKVVVIDEYGNEVVNEISY